MRADQRSKRLSILDSVRVASPCPASWAAMHGDERVRFCDSCKLHVFNLSEMTRSEAEALVQRTTGRLCVRYYQRADGTILTTDCPVGLWRLRRRFIRTLAGVAAAFALVATGLQALARGERGTVNFRLAYFEPFSRTLTKLECSLLGGNWSAWPVTGDIDVYRDASHQECLANPADFNRDPY